MRSAVTVFIAALPLAAAAQNFTLEGAVIDSRSAASLGVVSERGDVAQLFRAQKALTFGILRAAGIALDQLTPDVRQRIERFQTTNLDAFRAFSTGLDLKDQGRYAEAKEFFRRAADLDPGFGLAADQQRAMPEVTVGGQLQARAVIVAAAGQAVDRGRQTVTVDLAHALAAMQAGQAVYVVNTPAESAAATASAADAYSVNAAGSAARLTPNPVAGVAFDLTQAGLTTGLVLSGEWLPEKAALAADGTLLQLGAIDLATGFLAQLDRGSSRIDGSATLADGSTVSWGTWSVNPATGGSPLVRLGATPARAPDLGPVGWMVGQAPREMPSSGTAVLSPAGGMFGAATGTLSVNFGLRTVQLNNLGFTLGALQFSGLNGNASYDASKRSGAFAGSYSTGSCTGCVAFSATGSSFNGNFVGKAADGAILATSLQTGDGTATGIHLFTQAPPKK